MVRIKICGITNSEDALAAVRYGADALGFVFYKKSPRCIEIEKAKEIISNLPPFTSAVGVFVNESFERINRIIDECKIKIIQLHGDEKQDFCSKFNIPVIKSISMENKNSFEKLKPYRVSAFILDSYSQDIPGGTGKFFDWNFAIKAKRYGEIILAGGLTKENVKDAILKVNPYAVDVSSGFEIKPGKKDHGKMKKFIEAVRGL